MQGTGSQSVPTIQPWQCSDVSLHVWHPLVQQQSPVTKYCKCASLANVSSHFSGVKSIQIVGELKPVPEWGLLHMQEALHNASWWVSAGIAVINKSQTGLT